MFRYICILYINNNEENNNEVHQFIVNFNKISIVCICLDMKRFNDGHSNAPFKRPKMGPDDIELRVLIPSKVFLFFN